MGLGIAPFFLAAPGKGFVASDWKLLTVFTAFFLSPIFTPDPLLFHLMEDPVKLPSSGQSVDRSTIKSYLLGEKIDPVSVSGRWGACEFVFTDFFCRGIGIFFSSIDSR